MMAKSLRLPFSLMLLLVLASLVQAQAERAPAQSSISNEATLSERSTAELGNDEKKKRPDQPADPDANKTPAPDPNATIADPLVRMLIAKGVLTAEEGHAVSAAVLYRLAEVYRLARYATHTVDPTMRDQARAALGQVRAGLAGERVP